MRAKYVGPTSSQIIVVGSRVKDFIPGNNRLAKENNRMKVNLLCMCNSNRCSTQYCFLAEEGIMEESQEHTEEWMHISKLLVVTSIIRA